MSTLSVVEQILREAAVPMSVKEIVERAGAELPTKSKTPDTVVARDLSMDIKRKGDASVFVRTAPGRYAMREQLAARIENSAPTSLSEKAVGEKRAPTKAAAHPDSRANADAPAPAAALISIVER